MRQATLMAANVRTYLFRRETIQFLVFNDIIQNETFVYNTQRS